LEELLVLDVEVRLAPTSRGEGHLMEVRGSDPAGEEQRLRDQAIKRIKRRRKFLRDLLFFLLVNAALWAIWALNGAETDDLWPAWVSGIWGALLVLDAWKAYGERPISDSEIEEEMSQLRS
jgi:hypothetical protein